MRAAPALNSHRGRAGHRVAVTAGHARTENLRSGVRLELFTVAWMAVEAGVAIAAGVAAASLILTAFGLDSLIELVSGAVVLWRLRTEMAGGDPEGIEPIEHRATQIVAVTLALLCLYVAAGSLYGLASQARPHATILGIGVSLAATLVMPYLGLRKRDVGSRLQSEALRGDAAESFTCGYMAATVVVGLILTGLFGWWWAQYAAALPFLFWLLRETWEAFEEAGASPEHDGEGRRD